MTYRDIKHNEEVNELLKKGNRNLGLLGYTDHSQAHCVRVAETAAHILKKFGYPEHDIELARIAGYMHDIGNAVNRSRHAEYGGLLANEILKQYDLSIPDRITIVSAIANHDESTGGAVDPISAALIIGDKTDVRRTRVREKPKAAFDIHDRVNYAVTDQKLKIDTEKKVISLNLQIDTDICSMYEYFEIFLQRMLMCRGAADMLGATFKLTANGAPTTVYANGITPAPDKPPQNTRKRISCSRQRWCRSRHRRPRTPCGEPPAIARECRPPRPKRSPA